MSKIETESEQVPIPAPVLPLEALPPLVTHDMDVPFALGHPKLEREYRAFRRMLPELLQTHRDKYVAVHQEQVVDSGDDRFDLLGRVWKRIGRVEIYVGLVTDVPQRVSRVPRYRIVGERQ